MSAKSAKALDDAFLAALGALGAPASLRASLKSFLRVRHPGDQDRIYHGLAHTYEVASLTARLLDSWPRVPAGRKVLLILAAALHDVDPERAPNTLARVDATIDHLETDRAAVKLLREFSSRFDFTPNQVLALILATDYASSPVEMRRKLKAFERAHREAFGDDPFIPEWGRRLAYWDQIATYLGPIATSRKRVAGLAREFRATHARVAGGMRVQSLKFLRRLRADPLFEYLPRADRARFDALLADLSA